jgi:hypothetical protein
MFCNDNGVSPARGHNNPQWVCVVWGTGGSLSNRASEDMSQSLIKLKEKQMHSFNQNDFNTLLSITNRASREQINQQRYMKPKSIKTNFQVLTFIKHSTEQQKCTRNVFWAIKQLSINSKELDSYMECSLTRWNFIRNQYQKDVWKIFKHLEISRLNNSI